MKFIPVNMVFGRYRGPYQGVERLPVTIDTGMRIVRSLAFVPFKQLWQTQKQK